MTQRQTHDHRPAFHLAAVAVIAGAAAILSPATASGQQPTSNEAQTIDLGVKPDITAGAVLVVKTNAAYLTFNGTQYGADGSAIGDGQCVIQLSGCSDWDFRSGGDEELAAHPVDLDALDLCETFEVANSDWSGGDGRHFIFTFVGISLGATNSVPHFECLATSATPHVLATDSFDMVLEYIDYLEMESGMEDPGDIVDDPAEDPSDDPDYDPDADDSDYDSDSGYDPDAEDYDSGYDSEAYE